MIEANDAARRQTAPRRDASSVAAAGSKLQGNAADKHDGSQRAKAAGVKAERNLRYENNERFVCGKQGHKQWDCPYSHQGKVEKGVHVESHGYDQAAAASAAEAAIHKRFHSTYPEQSHWDSPCVCHPYGWS